MRSRRELDSLCRWALLFIQARSPAVRGRRRGSRPRRRVRFL